MDILPARQELLRVYAVGSNPQQVLLRVHFFLAAGSFFLAAGSIFLPAGSVPKQGFSA